MQTPVKYCVLGILFFIQINSIYSQSSPQFGLGLQAGVSHSGWNLALVGNCRIKNFNPYIGPSISLNRGLPGRGPLGINVGLDYIIETRKAWLGTVANFDYQLNLFPSEGKQDVIHEFHLSYGLRLQTQSGFYVIQQMGYGFYLESSYVEIQNARQSVSGYNGLIKLRAGYYF